MNAMDIEDIELKLLVEAIRLRYGYDFRHYVATALKRRLSALMQKAKVTTLSELQGRLIHDEAFFVRVLPDFTVGTSEMFRDPEFFRSLREHVFPILRTYAHLKIWHAGCSTGEEVYSLAILLKEEGLYERATIYATDLNAAALKAAKGARYSAEALKVATQNYHKAGGSREFSQYYHASADGACMDEDLSENVVFAEHNLVTDEVFSEMHLILCRNVLIYFNRTLQSRVLDLFSRSLCYKGFLCLGDKESVRFLRGSGHFRSFAERSKIYRKVTTSGSEGMGLPYLQEGGG